MAMDATTLLGSQVGAAAACSYILNLAQRAKSLPWITAHTTEMNIAARAVMALFTTLGLSYVWSPSTDGGHTLTIAIPSLMTAVLGLWHWFCQFAFQHIVGQTLGGTQSPVQPPAAPLIEK
jgi:hypothetical protein